jgi:DNA-binding CsgD family transcriptional regulator/sugar-specific transcriptional regulator TrmB
MALRDLGFTELQEAVYRILLGTSRADLDALATGTGASPGAVVDALDGLVDLGVAQVDVAAPAGVTLGNPTVTLGQLIEKVEDDLLRRHRGAGNTRAELAQLAALQGAPAAAAPDVIEKVDNVEMVRKRLEELAFFTRSSAYSIQPGGPQSPASLAASRPLDHRGLRRGIDMRIVHEATVLDDELNSDYLRELVALGAKVRVTDEPIQRLIIMDERVAVVPIDPANSSRGALIVQQPGLLAGFLRLFHRTWDAAKVLAWEEAPDPAGELTEEDRQVLAFLATGKTDETAARELGVSVRHLRRRVARLMNRLGAASRFEAGVEASRRAWI